MLDPQPGLTSGYKRFPLPTSVFRLPFLFLAGVNAELEEEDRRSLVDEFVSCLAFYLLSIVNSSTKQNLPVLFSVGSSGSWILKANHPGTRALHR